MRAAVPFSPETPRPVRARKGREQLCSAGLVRRSGGLAPSTVMGSWAHTAVGLAGSVSTHLNLLFGITPTQGAPGGLGRLSV